MDCGRNEYPELFDDMVLAADLTQVVQTGFHIGLGAAVNEIGHVGGGSANKIQSQVRH